jgi:hypothetical protein
MTEYTGPALNGISYLRLVIQSGRASRAQKSSLHAYSEVCNDSFLLLADCPGNHLILTQIVNRVSL